MLWSNEANEIKQLLKTRSVQALWEKLIHENETGSNCEGFARRSNKDHHSEKNGFPQGRLAAEAVTAVAARMIWLSSVSNGFTS